MAGNKVRFVPVPASTTLFVVPFKVRDRPRLRNEWAIADLAPSACPGGEAFLMMRLAWPTPESREHTKRSLAGCDTPLVSQAR